MIAYRIQNDIELVRELSGLTIKEIADLTGVSRMTISRWMCGQVQIYREDSVMKQIDEEALHICRFQARVFEISAKITECSLGIFLRRFMCSDTAKRMDTQTFLFESIVPGQVVKEVNDKYSKSSYGSDKYNAEELYWIGYI